MNSAEFAWFPKLEGDERVLVFVDAKLGSILNLDGSLRSTHTSNQEFFRKFGSRAEALIWARGNQPSRGALRLLYDKEKKEEYFPAEG